LIIYKYVDDTGSDEPLIIGQENFILQFLESRNLILCMSFYWHCAKIFFII